MPQTNLTKARARAKALGVTVQPSTRQHKKLDVYRNGQYQVSIGDLRYSDFLQHGDPERLRTVAGSWCPRDGRAALCAYRSKRRKK